MRSAVAHVFVFTTCHLSVILVQMSGTKKTQSAAGASFCLPILELSCSLFVRSKVKLLTLPLIPPHTLLPSAAKALSTESPYLHGLDFFHGEERNLVHSQSPRSGPHRQSGHVIHHRTMTILWGSERGGGVEGSAPLLARAGAEKPPPPTPFPFRPRQSPALVPLGSRGQNPIRSPDKSKQSLPTVN